MKLVLDLTDEELARLRRKAEMAGLDGAALLRMFINDTPPTPNGGSLTPAEAVEYWTREGLLGAFADRADSPDLARELRTQASRRAWS